jgi:cobalt-precorrin 5A hydrolase
MAGGAVIVAGFGFRAAATADSLADALARAGGPAGVTRLATAADKAEAPAFRALAGRLRLPVSGIAAALLARQATATDSDASRAARGTGSLAEAAALAAVGPGARLVAPRAVSADRLATCALAVEGSGQGKPGTGGGA